MFYRRQKTAEPVEKAEENVQPEQQPAASSWERNLEALRSRRQQGAPTQESAKAVAFHSDYERVCREYLHQWQAKHNAKAEQSDDTTVLLQEDWLNAQQALQRPFSEAAVGETATVWINPKRRKTAEPSADTLPENAQENSAESDAGEDEAGGNRGIPVQVNVLLPQNVPYNRPVLCLSETELLERIRERLKPHLTDAVNGLIRTTVQKQAQQMIYGFQAALSEQAPSLVDEILDYDLRTVFADIKYDAQRNRKP